MNEEELRAARLRSMEERSLLGSIEGSHMKRLIGNLKSSKEEHWFGLTNVVQEKTGLPVTIWITSHMSNLEPLIIVQADYTTKLKREPLITVSISDKPKIAGDTGLLSENDIQLIKCFVQINHDTLLSYWNEIDIDVVNIISMLRRVE